MADIHVTSPAIDLQDPTLVEGLPGAGLVGKIAADHLVEVFEMEYYAGVHCDGLPEAAVYRGEHSDLRPPVRLHADEERNLLVLQSDVPVSPSEATDFAACLTEWIEREGASPVYVSGRPTQDTDAPPELYGVSTGDGDDRLDDAGIVPPAERGAITGPTGALLYRAGLAGLSSVGLVVEANPQLPDPEAARRVLEHGIEPLTGLAIDTGDLADQAAEIDDAREELAKKMQAADDESSEAQPLRMFQ